MVVVVVLVEEEEVVVVADKPSGSSLSGPSASSQRAYFHGSLSSMASRFTASHEHAAVIHGSRRQHLAVPYRTRTGEGC